MAICGLSVNEALRISRPMFSKLYLNYHLLRGPFESIPNAVSMATKTELRQRRRVIFVHPDLGIGGAERLVIDAAVGLQSMGHNVTVLTSYRDPNHCFEEARDGTYGLVLEQTIISLYGHYV